MIVENLAPIQETFVGSDDEAGSFIAARNEPKEETGFGTGKRQIANLVDDEQLGIGQLLERAFEPIFTLGFDQAGHQTLQGEEQGGIASLDGLDAKADAEMRFSAAIDLPP
jgi:hypothetical protein